MSGSLWPHGLQHSRLPCPSPTPRACSNSCPLRRWCRPTISSSVVPLSSCPQSFLASESFPMSRLFASGSWILPSQLAWEISEKTGCFEVWKAGPFTTASPRGFNAAPASPWALRKDLLMDWLRHSIAFNVLFWNPVAKSRTFSDFIFIGVQESDRDSLWTPTTYKGHSLNISHRPCPQRSRQAHSLEPHGRDTGFPWGSVTLEALGHDVSFQRCRGELLQSFLICWAPPLARVVVCSGKRCVLMVK